jgi:uncharacterized membrane protein (DUF485 family)
MSTEWLYFVCTLVTVTKKRQGRTRSMHPSIFMLDLYLSLPFLRYFRNKLVKAELGNGLQRCGIVHLACSSFDPAKTRVLATEPHYC